MRFAMALMSLEEGCFVARQGWNGKGMYLLQADGGSFSIRGYVMGDLEKHIVMKTADDKFVPWLASQTDLLATDWTIVGANIDTASVQAQVWDETSRSPEDRIHA